VNLGVNGMEWIDERKEICFVVLRFFVCVFVCLCVCVFVCLFVCLFVCVLLLFDSDTICLGNGMEGIDWLVG